MITKSRYGGSCPICQMEKLSLPNKHDKKVPCFALYYPFDIQGVQEKSCLFTIHCNPSLAYIAVSDHQRNASVQSLLLAGNFLYNQ